MKVIKLGDLYATIELACPKCNSVLEINNSDIKFGWGATRYVTCPCCNEIVRLSEEQKKELKL